MRRQTVYPIPLRICGVVGCWPDAETMREFWDSALYYPVQGSAQTSGSFTLWCQDGYVNFGSGNES